MELLRTGIYEHYKGHLVMVVGISYHTETVEPFVTYIHFGKDSLERENGLWIRPYSMFMDEVEVDGKKVPRFKYVGEKI